MEILDLRDWRHYVYYTTKWKICKYTLYYLENLTKFSLGPTVPEIWLRTHMRNRSFGLQF